METASAQAVGQRHELAALSHDHVRKTRIYRGQRQSQAESCRRRDTVGQTDGTPLAGVVSGTQPSRPQPQFRSHFPERQGAVDDEVHESGLDVIDSPSARRTSWSTTSARLTAIDDGSRAQPERHLVGRRLTPEERDEDLGVQHPSPCPSVGEQPLARKAALLV